MSTETLSSQLQQLAESLMGRSFSLKKPYQVGREKIREFAGAIGDDNALFRDVADAQAHGYPDLVAPPTFTIVVTMAAIEQMLTDPEVGIDLRQLVHADQRFAFTRPVCATDELSCTMTVEKVRMMAGNALVSTRAAVIAAQGEPVATAEATLVVRAIPSEADNG